MRVKETTDSRKLIPDAGKKSGQGNDAGKEHISKSEWNDQRKYGRELTA